MKVTNEGEQPKLYGSVSPGDLTSPIDIQAVVSAVRAHGNLLVTLQSLAAAEILQHFTAMPGIRDSYTLGRTEIGAISHKYTGIFKGQDKNGKIVPRTLVVRPCVMEMADEPERYRRAYITEVAGGLNPNSHPFEIWLNNYGIQCASQDLHAVLLTAKYDAAKEDLGSAFDGPLTILEAEKTAGNISKAKGNLFETGKLTRANIGTKLLAMYRSLPAVTRRQNVKLHMSIDLGDMYDDWLDDQGTLITGSGAETAGQKYLRGTNGKCEIVRLTGMPEGSQFVWITVKENQVWGFDKNSDMNRIVPFNGGNPYLYTAAGKYVIGFQFVSIDKTLLLINDQPVTPEEDAADDSEPEETATYSAVTGDDLYDVADDENVTNPKTAGWYEKDGSTYSVTTDETITDQKVYYVAKSPKTEGWYTRSGESEPYTYTATNDQTQQVGVTYYVKD